MTRCNKPSCTLGIRLVYQATTTTVTSSLGASVLAFLSGNPRGYLGCSAFPVGFRLLFDNWRALYMISVVIVLPCHLSTWHFCLDNRRMVLLGLSTSMFRPKSTFLRLPLFRLIVDHLSIFFVTFGLSSIHPSCFHCPPQRMKIIKLDIMAKAIDP